MRKLLIVFACIVLVLLGGYTSWRGYRVWKQKHMLAMAHNFMKKGDAKNAALSVRQALRTNPRNYEAVQLMATLAEAAGDRRAAVLWWARAVELKPKGMDDRLALARTAIGSGLYSQATNALAGISPEGKQTAAYHMSAGSVALAARLVPEAEQHYAEACRLEPTNPAPQLYLSVVRLGGTNELDLAEARIGLQRILAERSNVGAIRCAALRGLAVDASRFKDKEKALGYSKELSEDTNSAYSDRLLRLSILSGTGDSEFTNTLRRFESDAAGDPAKATLLGQWEATQQGAAAALAWLGSLNPEVRTNRAVAMLEADCLTSTQDWPALQKCVEHQNWGEMDFLRHLSLSRALREQSLTAAAKAEWGQALRQASGRAGSLELLAQIAALWKWQTETEDTLWTVVNQHPDQKWAFDALSKLLFATGRTRPLMTLLNQELKHTPTAVDIKNNVAVIAMLLDATELNPYEMAKDVYTKVPTNPAYASTYALSLYLQKKNAEALKVMESLDSKVLENPSIAGYYGVILKANGEGEKAKTYLALSSKAAMLPEEKKMFERAAGGT